MGELKLIEAVKVRDIGRLRSLLAGGTKVDGQDEQGWTALNWAAGAGDVDAVELLIEHGADVAATGRDCRTPLMIAKAAGHQEVAAILAAAEKDRGIWVDPRQVQPYCKAYYLRDLRRFGGWSEGRFNWKEPGGEDGAAGSVLTDDDFVYLHQDFTVTRSMWHEESVIFNEVTPEWREFCERELEFEIPEDLL